MTANDAGTVLLTGGYGALGGATTEAIRATRPDWTVAVAGRDERRLAEVSAAAGREPSGAPRVLGVPVDLASLDAVRAVPALLDAADAPPLRAIVCAAGIQATDRTRATEDGYELMFGVNHLAHLLLVALLLDRLQAPARVVVVSSGTHAGTLRQGFGYPGPQWASAEQLARPAPAPARPPREGQQAYATSKLANLYFAYELHRRAPAGLTVNAFDPGLMPGTGLARDYGRPTRWAWDHVLPVLVPLMPGFNKPATSGRALAELAVGPTWAGVSGEYVEWGRRGHSSPESHDLDRARRLWEDSLRLVGLPATWQPPTPRPPTEQPARRPAAKSD